MPVVLYGIISLFLAGKLCEGDKKALYTASCFYLTYTIISGKIFQISHLSKLVDKPTFEKSSVNGNEITFLVKASHD